MKKQDLYRKHFSSAELKLVTEWARYYRRILFFTLIFGVFLSSYSGLPNAAADPAVPAHTEFTFDRYEIVTGVAKRQTVLTGFLLGGAIAEVAVVHIDENDSRHLRIYTFSNGTWTPKFDTTLCPEVVFVDVANICLLYTSDAADE